MLYLPLDDEPKELAASDVSDPVAWEAGSFDHVGLVTTVAPDVVVVVFDVETDVVATRTGHHDGVAFDSRLQVRHGFAPLGPGSRAEVLSRNARASLDSPEATDATTPSGFAVIRVEPLGRSKDGCADAWSGS